MGAGVLSRLSAHNIQTIMTKLAAPETSGEACDEMIGFECIIRVRIDFFLHTKMTNDTYRLFFFERDNS